MLLDAKKQLDGVTGPEFLFQSFDCGKIPYPNQSFDRVVANHVLFYVNDLDLALTEIKRVLREEGIVYCSTYGKQHMKEVTELVHEFDPRITLSEVSLYDRFGLENGSGILKKYFSSVEKKEYEDSLIITEAEPLLDYILSCHGNQNERLNGRKTEFKEFIKKKIREQGQVKITKQAGVLICRKNS